MDLANTDVEIRERSLPQRVDLTFRFIASRFRGVVAYAALGVIPAMIGNVLLLWILDPYHAWSNQGWGWAWALMVYLTWVESPWVMAPLVVYLGATLFRQPISGRLAIREAWQKSGHQLFVHGLVRTQVLWCGLVLLAYGTLSPGLLVASLVAGVILLMIFWSFRPYVDQIIFLERLPLLFKSDHPMTIGKRSAMLHGADVGRVVIESMINFLLAAVVFYATYGMLLWGYYWWTFNTVTQDWFGWTLFALAWWCSMVVSTVVRFFGYLDSRIRAEGWELELRVRREAEQQLAAGIGQPRATTGRIATAANLGGQA